MDGMGNLGLIGDFYCNHRKFLVIHVRARLGTGCTESAVHFKGYEQETDGRNSLEVCGYWSSEFGT